MLWHTMLLLTLVAGGEPPGPADGPHVVCRRAATGELSGRLEALGNGRLVLVGEDGACELAISDFREIAFDRARPTPSGPQFVLWGRDGRVLKALRLRSERDGVIEVDGDSWRGTGLSLASVAAVARGSFVCGASRDGLSRFEAARISPPKAYDLLRVAGAGGAQTVSCAVEALTEEGADVVLGGERRRVPWRRIEWMVFSGAGSGTPGAGHLVELTDGSRLRLAELRIEGRELRGSDGPASYSVRLDRVRRIEVRSEAYRYLSCEAALSVETRPLIDVVWPPRSDRCVTGGPLRLGGRAYARGLGMHTRTRMTFALDGGYSLFCATVGVDDSAGGLGSVAFRVLADGRTAFESPVMRGGDPPLDIQVRVAGAKRLTLVADFGGTVVASGNFADWAEARLVR